MTPDTINAIKDALAPVAAKIGQGAEYGWSVVIRQQYVTAVEGLLMALGGIIGIIITLIVAKKLWNSFTSSWTEKPVNTGILMIGGTAIGMCIPAIVIGLDQAVTHFLNPAYYALDFFIHLAK